MDWLALVARSAAFLAGSLAVGVFAFLLLVLRPAAGAAAVDAEAALGGLERRLLRLGAGAVAAALAAALLDLVRQTAVATGGGLAAALQPSALVAVLLGTRYGATWLVRQGLLVLLGVLLLLADPARDARDRVALRLEAGLLAGLSLALVAAAGHAASAQPAPLLAMPADGLHLLATGVWFGALGPLALALAHARGLGEAGRRLAAHLTDRFATVGLAGVGLLLVTGVVNTWEQVGSVPALFGTAYGRWLCLKLALLVPLLAVAAVNHLVLRPRLRRAAAATAGDAGDPPAVDRLRRNVRVEVALGVAIVAVVAVLGVTTPGRHAVVAWPFAIRLSWSAARGVPGAEMHVALGSQLAVFGLVAALVALIVRRRRWPWIAGAGAVAIATGATVALRALAVDAYPTTYVRPAVPYTATSIASGQALYRANCAVCHGPAGYGDGPAARALHPRPADLTARHTADHTVGDLFWWLSHGIRGSAMPAFGGTLSEEERWDVINFVRTLAAAEQARRLGPVVDPGLAVVAPDFTYTRGVGEEASLKDSRGLRMVLLVFFTLPGSAPRLVDLARAEPALTRLGAAILGVPTRAADRVYRDLGPRPVFFPIAVDGAADAAAAYRLFRRDLTEASDGPTPPPLEHMELLIDRQGYLRARWVPGADGWRDPTRLIAEVERLAREPARAAVADEHVH